MSYNFTDDPSPDLTTFIDAAGDVRLTDGSPQGDLITDEFAGTSVSISIIPPSGWSLSAVDWNTGNGTYTVPSSGNVDTYTFDFQVTQGAVQKNGNGVFKIKKSGGT